VVSLMQEAGCVQVQIGIESGDQGQLDRMHKRTTVQQNARALATCRRLGLRTVVSLVVGFPGETPATLDNTAAFLEATPPDFHFQANFSTRVATVPILRPEHAEPHDLVTDENLRTVSPYWRHRTMSCADVGHHVRALARTLVERRVSPDAAVFYRGMLRYHPALRPELLDFQAASLDGASVLSYAFDVLNGWIDRRLRADVDRTLVARPRRSPLPLAHV
jgi:hypothetical protein